MPYSAKTAAHFTAARLALHCAMFTFEKPAALFAALQ
jgi:hypothetical protein